MLLFIYKSFNIKEKGEFIMTLCETLRYSNFTPEDKEKIQKIKKILCKINKDFHNAEPGIGSLKIDGHDFQWERNENSSAPISRREYINSHPEIQDALDFSFSLSADDIIAQKIPMQVMGCTGVAKLFSKYAQEENLDCFTVFTANIKKLEERKTSKQTIVDGHQIIAVQFSDGVRMFDPACKDGLQFYKDNEKEILVPSMRHLLGKELVSQNSKDPWAQRQAGAIITFVEPSSKLKYIKSYKDVENRYLMGELTQQTLGIQKE